MVQEEPEGEIKIVARYNMEEEYPHSVTINDYRVKDDVITSKLSYNKNIHSISVKNTNGFVNSKVSDERKLIDNVILRMIHELYDDNVEIYDHYSYNYLKVRTQEVMRRIRVTFKEIFGY